jgi:molybdopterin-guanine dinucleotide biosynthesis protein A
VTLVCVLAGGASRRMGAPKPAVELGGRPLISYPLAAAAQAGLRAVVVAKASTPLPSLDVTVWTEPDEPHHPLLGLVTALERAGEPVVAVACDQPWLTAALLERVAEAGGPAAALTVDGRLEPFPARYEPSALPALRQALEAGASMRATLASLSPRSLGEVEPDIVAGVNTPEALAEAARRIG